MTNGLSLSVVVVGLESAPNTEMMSLERAATLTQEIKQHAGSIRQALSEVYHGRGYEALGYLNFSEYLVAEFGWSPQHGYRLKDAGDIEGDLRALVPDAPTDIPHKHLLALKSLPSPVERAEAYANAVRLAAAEGSPVTERHIRVSVTGLDSRKRVLESHNAVVIQMMTVGTVTSQQAVKLLEALEKLTPRKRGYLVQLMAKYELTNVDLVAPIAEMFERPTGKESLVLPEVLTGHLNRQPLKVATSSDLAAAREEARKAHIAASEEEARQKRIEEGLAIKADPVPVTIYPGDRDKTMMVLAAGLSPHYPGDTDWLGWLAGVMLEV